ncbi:hypothetical protein [Streptomyces sp. 3211]|uniref:hypothetical protein n=1 Tax=Streptomyces sp. 3211 TaxID=1964449 RepID=UPI0013317B22|nr:hypothetical protein [Streptomyces sp. 3211]
MPALALAPARLRDKATLALQQPFHLRKRRINAVITGQRHQAAKQDNKSSRGGRPVIHDADLNEEGNTVEAPDQQAQSLAGHPARFDTTPESYLAGLHLPASTIWLKPHPDHSA